jgi:hypothetical protein
MQWEVTDEAAISFATEFYSSIASGVPIDRGVSFARMAMYADGAEIEWATPVLYLSAPDGRIFDIERTRAVEDAIVAKERRQTVLEAQEDRRVELATREAEEKRRAEQAAREVEQKRRAEQAEREAAEEKRRAEHAARQADEQLRAEEAARQAEEQRKQWPIYQLGWVSIAGAALVATAVIVWTFPSELDIGGNWRGIANKTPVVLTIKSLPLVHRCHPITGTMANNGGSGLTDISGFFCPKDGTLTFSRSSSGTVCQQYKGNVVERSAAALRIEGMFTVAEAGCGGTPGTYTFWIDRPFHPD